MEKEFPPFPLRSIVLDFVISFKRLSFLLHLCLQRALENTFDEFIELILILSQFTD